MSADIVISFDATGSMYPCIGQVKRRVEELVDRVFSQVTDLRIGIMAHGDYCDEREYYVLLSHDLTNNRDAICRFIRDVGPTHGGDLPECYELVFNRARELSWRSDATKVLVVVGDSIPHTIDYHLNRDRLNWRAEVYELGQMGISIYGVHCMSGIRQEARHFYQELAEMTGGYYITLDQFSAVHDLLLAVCLAQEGEEHLNRFLEEMEGRRSISRSLDTAFTTLGSTRRRAVRDIPPGLVPVPSGRFQMMEVDEDTPIAAFVRDNGLIFRVGRGFYEFTKKETIQERKEVVLMSREGDFYSGEQAREMIGLPYGQRGRISPVLLSNYTIFVQSTSPNRKLKADTRFLYEVTSDR